MNYVKRYIPSLVYDEIEKLQFKNKEHLYIICDMIYRISIFKKEDTDYSNTFTDIPNNYFRDIITKYSSYKQAMDILQDNKIIYSDHFYSKNSGKALGYRFNDDLISKLIAVDIKSKPLSKKIIQNKNYRNSLVNDSYKIYKDYFLNTFSIDYDEAISYINNLYTNSLHSINTSLCSDFLIEHNKIINRYNSLFITVNCINDGDLFFRKNQTNGRIDTNLTNLKSDLKQFISVKNLTQVDIVNSQPFILSLLLSHSINTSLCSDNLNINEVQKYIDWTSGGIFYEMFAKEYKKVTTSDISRKQIKDIMFCIFYSRNSSYIKEKKIFKSIFPTIMNWIEKQKEDRHNELAIKLQKIESKICIDLVCTELNNKGIKYYTIHDAWLVDDKDKEETEKIIIAVFYDKFNRRPELDKTKIN